MNGRRRLPAARRLAAEILATRVQKRPLAESEAFLLAQRSALSTFSGVEEFAIAPEAARSRSHSGCEHHLVLLRAQLARELWSRQLFVGVSVLDDLLFRAVAHDATTTPVRRVLEVIRDQGLHHPGLVLFPVHSFGILGAGLMNWATKMRVDYTSSMFGIALSAQSNRLDGTVSFLERARRALGVTKAVDEELIAHWYRSRSAAWLTRNPLLVIRVQSFPGEYYENQFLLMTTLRASTALISMLSCLQPETTDSDGYRLWSSATFNNFQTLDIRHYIVLYNAPSKRTLAGDCVPMHLRTPALSEISDLGIELNPRFWQRRSNLAIRIHQAVKLVHEGHLRYGFGRDKNTVFGRVFRKMFESLIFFRRSFVKSDDDWQATIGLAIAFEMLLTDAYAPRVNDRVVRRARLALRGVPGVRDYVDQVDKLYKARGGIVHAGSTGNEVDIRKAQKAFVLVFVQLAERMKRLSPSSSTPAKDLTGDTQA